MGQTLSSKGWIFGFRSRQEFRHSFWRQARIPLLEIRGRFNQRWDDFKIMKLRNLEPAEKQMLTALLQSVRDGTQFCLSLEGIMASDMNDGGMGSLLLVPDQDIGDRRFGRRLISGEFNDTDGVPVQLGVNLDQNGRLYELDIWKVDFSPISKWPDSSEIRIVAET